MQHRKYSHKSETPQNIKKQKTEQPTPYYISESDIEIIDHPSGHLTERVRKRIETHYRPLFNSFCDQNSSRFGEEDATKQVSVKKNVFLPTEEEAFSEFRFW